MPHALFAAIALFGILAMTVLFPLLAWLFFLLTRSSSDATQVITRGALHLDILIPAYNEESQIADTIRSIHSSAAQAKMSHPELTYTIVVGDNGSSDLTQSIAQSLGAHVFPSEQNLGKWSMLQKLLEQSSGNWVALVDAGCRWKTDLVSSWLGATSNPKVLAVAPAYFPSSESGLLERLSWYIERNLKNFENLAQGPVSIHGATVFYERNALIRALQYLGAEGKQWLNDDVVIPLALRMQNVQAKIQYLIATGSTDLHGEKPLAQNQSRRRQRLVAGNIQWVGSLLPQVCASNKTAAILSFRRIARILWIYWATLAYFSITLMILPWTTSVAIALCTWILVLAIARGAFDAAVASLRAPYFLLNKHTLESMAWR